jgi:protein TonB
MQLETDLFIDRLGPLSVEDKEDIPDLLTAAIPGEEQAASQFPLLSLELSGDDPVHLHARKVGKKDVALGTGGAFLVHVFLALTVLLSASFTSLPYPKEPAICVYLTEADENGCSSGDSGGLASTHTTKEPQESPSPEKEAVLSPANAAKTAELGFTTAVDTKKPAMHPKIRREPHAKNSPADSHANIAATKEAASENTGSGLGQEQVKGSGHEDQTGEGPGFSGLGGSSSRNEITGEFDAAKVDQVPQILKKIEPIYPNRARTVGICGKVLVRFLVEPDGRVAKASVVEAHPTGYFEQSALEAIRQWRFKPGVLRSQVVATWVTLPVQFQLIEPE